MYIFSQKSAYVDQANPDTSFEDATSLVVESFLNSNNRSYIEFGISNKPSTVNNARLWLYCFVDANYTRTHEARRITSSWVESLTWNTGQPTVTSTNLSSRTATSADSGGWVSWDVTSMFSDETGSTFGIQIKDQTEDYTSTANWSFYSDDWTFDILKRPLLELNGYYVKTTGNDTLDGQSWANAWATVNKAATTVPDGSTVHIGFGTYNAEPAGNKIAPQNAGSSGIKYLCETATTGGGTGNVIIEKN